MKTLILLAAVTALFVSSVAIADPDGKPAKTDWMSLFGPTQQKRIIERSKYYKYESATGLYWDFSLSARREDARRQIKAGKPETDFPADELQAFGLSTRWEKTLGPKRDQYVAVVGRTPEAVAWDAGHWAYEVVLGGKKSRFDGPQPTFVRIEIEQTLPDGSHLARVKQTPEKAVDVLIRIAGLAPTADGTKLQNIFASKDADLYQYKNALGATKTIDSYTVRAADQSAAVVPVTADELAKALALGKTRLPEYRTVQEDSTNPARQKILILKFEARDATPKPITPVPEDNSSQHPKSEAKR